MGRCRHKHAIYARWVCLLCIPNFVLLGNGLALGDTSGTPIQITRPAQDVRGGQAYRLIYVVDLPLDVYWRFKTDFDNSFLESNPNVLSHRLIAQERDVVITENRYSSLPDVFFRWRTRIAAERHRLDYELIDTNQSGHKFHYGTIRLQAENGATRITQTGYFDFWGASFWARYPFRGGMRSFLRESAEWEQRTAKQLSYMFEFSGRKQK